VDFLTSLPDDLGGHGVIKNTHVQGRRGGAFPINPNKKAFLILVCGVISVRGL
jgi:hypothetical protein